MAVACLSQATRRPQGVHTSSQQCPGDTTSSGSRARSPGKNISAREDTETDATSEIPDSSKVFAAAQKLSVFLVSRSALLPVSAAALIPLVAAGATQLPIKELLKIMKRLLLL